MQKNKIILIVSVIAIGLVLLGAGFSVLSIISSEKEVNVSYDDGLVKETENKKEKTISSEMANFNNRRKTKKDDVKLSFNSFNSPKEVDTQETNTEIPIKKNEPEEKIITTVEKKVDLPTVKKQPKKTVYQHNSNLLNKSRKTQQKVETPKETKPTKSKEELFKEELERKKRMMEGNFISNATTSNNSSQHISVKCSIYGEQLQRIGGNVKFRTLEKLKINNNIYPVNSIFYGKVKYQSESIILESEIDGQKLVSYTNGIQGITVDVSELQKALESEGRNEINSALNSTRIKGVNVGSIVSSFFNAGSKEKDIKIQFIDNVKFDLKI